MKYSSVKTSITIANKFPPQTYIFYGTLLL